MHFDAGFETDIDCAVAKRFHPLDFRQRYDNNELRRQQNRQPEQQGKSGKNYITAAFCQKLLYSSRNKVREIDASRQQTQEGAKLENIQNQKQGARGKTLKIPQNERYKNERREREKENTHIRQQNLLHKYPSL
jgi:hypothetical protein